MKKFDSLTCSLHRIAQDVLEHAHNGQINTLYNFYKLCIFLCGLYLKLVISFNGYTILSPNDQIYHLCHWKGILCYGDNPLKIDGLKQNGNILHRNKAWLFLACKCKETLNLDVIASVESMLRRRSETRTQIVSLEFQTQMGTSNNRLQCDTEKEAMNWLCKHFMRSFNRR